MGYFISFMLGTLFGSVAIIIGLALVKNNNENQENEL